MLFFRLIVHLLPRATAWQVTTQKMLRRLLEGLAQAPADVRDYLDAAWVDIFPATTRELAAWELQFGLTQPVVTGIPDYIAGGVVSVHYTSTQPFTVGQSILIGAGLDQHPYTITGITDLSGLSEAHLTVANDGPCTLAWSHGNGSVAVSIPAVSSGAYITPGTLIFGGITVTDIGPGPTPDQIDAARRAQLSAAWSAQGGQSPRYLEDIVRAAGFDVHLYEWWVPGSDPVAARDPRTRTHQPAFGSVQCEDVAYSGKHCCTATDTPPPMPAPPGVLLFELYPECNRWLANDPGYLVNLDLTLEAPPSVPDDAATWPYFLYWAGADFDTKALIPASRRAEFERLILKLCPTQQWLVVYATFV